MKSVLWTVLSGVVLGLVGMGALRGAAVPEGAVTEGAVSGKPQYTLFVFETMEEYEKRTAPGEVGMAYWGPWVAFMEEMKGAGVLLGGMPLKPEESVRQVRIRDGKTVVTKGPIVSQDAFLSGYFLLEVESEAEALKWAAKVPNVGQSVVEVRAGFPKPGG
ncbi:YciI family protein [Lacunimicrobium album]